MERQLAEQKKRLEEVQEAACRPGQRFYDPWLQASHFSGSRTASATSFINKAARAPSMTR